MELKDRIRIAVEASAKNLARALDYFEPTVGVNPYPERMIGSTLDLAIPRACAGIQLSIHLECAIRMGSQES